MLSTAAARTFIFLPAHITQQKVIFFGRRLLIFFQIQVQVKRMILSKEMSTEIIPALEQVHWKNCWSQMISPVRHPSKWFNWKRGPRNKQWWRWSRLVFGSVRRSSHGNYYFFTLGSRSDPCTESQGHELSLGQTYDSHDLPGAQILTIGRRWQIASYFRFQSGFVPLWPWGISPSWGTLTWGWPPVQLRRGSFSSPQRSADCFDLWTIKL